MANTEDFSWDLGELPFIWRPLLTPSNGGTLPDHLPFVLTMDQTTGVLRQKPNSMVADALRRAYDQGSEITGVMDEEGIGRKYADDFLGFLLAQYQKEEISGLRVLEIGCGNGYLLHRLHSLGAKVVGIEPGAHGQVGASRYGLDILRDYFPSPKLAGNYDLVILYCVLEHLEKPEQLMDQISAFLGPDGKIALAVPDCTPYIQNGDISMLFHEHWSYFEGNTLNRQLRTSGLSEVHIQPAGFGGLLYATARTNRTPWKDDEETLSHAIEQASRYRDLAGQMLSRLGELFRGAEHNGESVGIYVPSRAVNAFLHTGTSDTGKRFFDDNTALHGSYFPGINIPVEPRENLLASPTDRVLIFSHTFGRQLAAALSPQLPNTRITTWHELLQQKGHPVP